MSSHNSFSAYVEEIAGAPPHILPLTHRENAPLPLFLRTLYELNRAELFGRRVLLAFQKEGIEQPTPSEYANHVRKISQIMSMETILVLPRLASYSRNRLVRQGVPFVVSGRQMFLPMLLIDLRERFPRESRKNPAALSAPSQVLVIFYLLGNSVDGISLRELAVRLRYSSMTLSNVRDELESENLSQVVKDGRSRYLRLGSNRMEVWEMTKSRLRSPVKARHWVNWSSRSPKALVSGLNALTEFSLISEDHLPVFAMRDRDYRKLLETGEMHGCPGPEEADARVEAWKYDPAVLASGATVDRLSLYLSLRDSADERVQIALEGMLQEMSW
jgi:DNA-binding MarR family transcriptional regulator